MPKPQVTLLKSRIIVSVKAVERLKDLAGRGSAKGAVVKDGIGGKEGGEKNAVGHQVHPKPQERFWKRYLDAGRACSYQRKGQVCGE